MNYRIVEFDSTIQQFNNSTIYLMHHTLRGIVLRSTKYTDNSLIVNIYTDKFGLQAYLVRGANSKTTKIKSNYFQPLTFVGMVASRSEKQKLEHIREITEVKAINVENDPIKNSICFFINEIIYKTIQEEESNEQLFDFLENTLHFLQLDNAGSANFHLSFMVQYSRYRGFFPTENFSEISNLFDLLDGGFTHSLPNHSHFLDKESSGLIWQLMNTNYEGCSTIKMTNSQRRQILQALIDYYKLHNANTGEISSHLVLEQLF